MPCQDWPTHTEQSLMNDKRESVRKLQEQLDHRTAQACMAMRLLLKNVPAWVPTTIAERTLSNWYYQHKRLDEKNKR